MSKAVEMSTTVPDESQREQQDEALDYPEGGPRAWGVVFGSFCVNFSVFGIINTSAVFESYFTEHQLKGESPSRLAWIFSVYLFLIYFIGLLVGPVFDRHGHRILILTASILAVVSPFILSFCSEYYQIFLTFAVLSGMGGSLMSTPSIAAVGHWFCKRRGLAVGVATSAGGIGGIIFPLMLKVTLERYGFAWSMRILGFILLLLALPPNLLIRTRLPRSQKFTSIWPDVRVFLDPKLALCCCGIFFMEYGVLIPLTYIISYASTHGHNTTQAYMLPALLNAGSVVGRVIPGLVSDRLGRFNTMIITVGGCAVAVLALWLPNGKSEPMLISFAIILGFVSGGNVSLTPVCIGQLCDSRDYGRYLSGAMLVAGFGTLTGIPIGGAILGNQSSKGWTGLILFSSLSYVVSVCCFITARVLAVGWSLRVVY